MDNKLVIFFILVEVVILALCDQEAEPDSNSFNSFGNPPNENTTPGDFDLSQEKDTYMFKPKEGGPDGKNIRNIPPIEERFVNQPDAKSFENSQNMPRNNFNEQRNMPQFNPQNGFQNAFNNWQQEKRGPFFPNQQEIQQRNVPFQTFNGRNAQNNNWGRNVFQNSQQQWNEQQYQDVKMFGNNNGRTINSGNINGFDSRENEFVENSWVYNPPMNRFHQHHNPMPQKKVSVTLVDEEIKAMENFAQNVHHNRYNPHINPQFNRNLHSFGNPNQDKGIVINFNSDCPTGKSPEMVSRYPDKPYIPKTRLPTYQTPSTPEITESTHISHVSPIPQIPVTPIFARRITTPIYCL